MVTIEEIKNLRRMNADINALNDRLLILRSQAERVTSALTHAKVMGGQPMRIEDTIQKMMELDVKLARKLYERELVLLRIEDWLYSLPAEEADVIRLRYVDGLSWRQVARQMHYSAKQPYYIQRKAFDRLRRA